MEISKKNIEQTHKKFAFVPRSWAVSPLTYVMFLKDGMGKPVSRAKKICKFKF